MGGEIKMVLYPLREIERLDRQMNRLMRDLWGSEFELPALTGAAETLPAFRGWRMPAVDIKETDKKITVTAEIPGVKKEDISIDVHDSHLEIKAEEKEEKKEEKEGYVYQERREGKFFRSMELPASVNADKTKASYKDGVLTLSLPKAEKAIKKKIAIE
jgi:HSP20 family protein